MGRGCHSSGCAAGWQRSNIQAHRCLLLLLLLLPQSAIINLYLYSADASEDDDPIAEYNRRGYEFTTLLEAHNLPVGQYVIVLEVDYFYGQANFTALLHLWDLAFQDPQNANDLMTVSPFHTVPVGPAGAAALHLAFRHIDVPAPDEWPPTRCDSRS